MKTLTKIKLTITGFLVLIQNSCVVQDQPTTSSETNPIIEAVDKVIKDELIKQNIPGAAVAIVKNGEIVHISGYGHSSLDRNDPITVNTVFRWASISKPLTTVAILQYAEQNEGFSIDDTVTKYVSYWPTTGGKQNITIKQLLSNRSGIIHYTNTDNCPNNSSPSPNNSAHDGEPFNAENAVNIFKNQNLCFTPGTNYKYSTYGFTLAAAALEGASGTTYSDWIMEKIAEPLNLNSLQQATGTSEGYNISEGRLVNRNDASKSSVLPGGGWESNIRDLALFGNALLQNSLLENTSRMWTENTGNTVYRLGVYRRNNGYRVNHGGDHNNLRTQMELYPERSDKLGIFIYVNGRHADRDRFTRRVAIAMGETSRSASDEAIVDECTDESGSSRYSAVWRKTDNDVILRKGLSHSDFGAEWSYLREHGYYTDDFEVYTENNELRWDGVFRKGPGGNAMWRNFTKDGFNEKWKEQSELGFRLVDIETYVVNGERLWAGLFRPGSGPYALFRYYNTSDFGEKREEMAESGLKLIDIEAFTHNGNLLWAGVWIEGEDGLLNRNFTQTDFGELRSERRATGYKLIDIESYNTNNGVRWAGIWEKTDTEERLNRNFPFCGEKNDDENGVEQWDPLGITNLHNQYRQNGFELIDWERN